MIERLFKLSEHKTTGSRELIAGLTTFAAMAYIMAVNPNILAAASMPKEPLIVVTALAAAAGCFLIAMLTNYPIALAPGMGTNAYFAFVICLGMQIPWQAALSLTFWNGIIFLVLSITGLRSRIAECLPQGIKIGIQTGIGFFIAFIGLKNVGIVINDEATLVSVGELASPSSILVMLGIVAIAVMTVWKIPGAILYTVIGITIAGIFVPVGDGSMITQLGDKILSLPPSIEPTFAQLDIFYPFTNFSVETVTVLITLLMLDMFDSLGTLVGLGRRAKLMNAEGKMPKMGKALSADAIATSVGAVLGTSTTTSYIESAAGIESGGRTGLTSIVVGLCFLLSLFFVPLIGAIPTVATTPALVMVGVFMAQGLRDLEFDNMAEMTGAVITMIMIPLTFSITEGIGLGLVVWLFMKVFSGQGRQIPILTYFIAVLFLAYYTIR
jgi:AGZA family xanthine/uracil permease-like MFS transporter